MSVVLIICAGIGFNSLFIRIANIITDKNDELFVEYSQNNAYSTSLEFNNTLSLIKASANIFSNVEDFGSAETLTQLHVLERDSPVSPILLIDSNGIAYGSDGETMDVSSEEFFQRSILGESGVFLDENKIILSACIIKDGKAVGVLSAYYDIFALSKLIETQTLDGNSYSMIINQQGDVLLRSQNEQSISPDGMDIWEFFDNVRFTISSKEQVYSDVQSLKSGQAAFTYKGETRHFYYTAIGTNNWVLFKCITQDYIDSTVQPVKVHAGYLAIVVTIICVLMAAIVIGLIILVNKRKNDQLLVAYSQAEKANSAKSMFLSRMSHEIRTPMNAIAGLTQICKTNAENPDKVRDCLNKIDQSSKILLNIINDVLDMSAIENGKMKIASNPFSITEILSTIAAVYYPQCRQKNIELNVLASKIPYETLIGDQLRINQILLNLISNAYKFTSSGGKIVVVASETVENNNVVLHLSVGDTGEGMTKEMQKRLFKPFEQESADTAQKHGGSGLGLSIVKNLCELMNGEISVESEKGKGTVFYVNIPVGFRNENPYSDERVKGMKILIADNDKTTLDYLGEIMEKMGVQSDKAESFESAEKYLEKTEQYDAVFVGRDFASKDKIPLGKVISAQRTGLKPVIITYTEDISEDKELYERIGIDKIMEKPVFQSNIYSMLSGILDAEEENSCGFGGFDFSGKRVLLAEDNVMNVEIATEFLKMVNMQVEVAQNGEIAVEKFAASAEGTYDIILMDMQMPVMGGIDATKAIRRSSHPQAKTIPILAMTANSYAEDISACLDAGMNAHISKPIDTMVLYQALHDALK
ncbi:MAG: response regulator [Hominimerdicola sp.]